MYFIHEQKRKLLYTGYKISPWKLYYNAIKDRIYQKETGRLSQPQLDDKKCQLLCPYLELISNNLKGTVQQSYRKNIIYLTINVLGLTTRQ